MKRSTLPGEEAAKQFLMRGVKRRAAVGGIVAACTLAVSSGAAGQCEPAWTPLGAGVDGYVEALTVFDDGSGPALYAGGNFRRAGGVSANSVAKWNGAEWSALGSGVSSSRPGGGAVTSLIVFDDGSGPALYAGGSFESAGGVAANAIARWDGSVWTSLGAGVGGVSTTPTPLVTALTVFDDGTGSGLYVGGDFSTAGDIEAHGIARWDGADWAAVDSGLKMGVPFTFEGFDDGAGGGSALYAAGLGLISTGGGECGEVLRWDGVTWSAVGEYPCGAWNSSLEVFDDGSGAALYVGEVGFLDMGIGRWDGTAWSFLPASPSARVLLAFDDGSGSALYAGGFFTIAGGVLANNIAVWDGSAWSALGGGTNDHVFVLAGFDDGSGDGPALYAGGQFTMADGRPASRIARWGCGDYCYADCDGNGELDFADFLCFQDAFAAGDLYADCDGSGAHDFFDFLCYQDAFAAGCSR